MSCQSERAAGHSEGVAAAAGRSLPGWRLAAAMGLLALIGHVVGQAADDDHGLVAGVGGVYRTGFWTPLVVPLRGDGSSTTRAWVADADGQLVGSPPAAEGDAERTISKARLSVRAGRPAAPLVIESLQAEQEASHSLPHEGSLAEQEEVIPGTSVPSTTPLLLLHGNLPAAAAAAAQLIAGERTPAAVVGLTDGPIPPGLAPRDLDAFDAAIICGRDVGSLSTATLAAIDGWVRLGGRLVFIAGESAEAVAASDTPAGGWLPGDEPRLVPLRSFGSLEAAARSGGLAGRVPRDGVRVPRFLRPAARSGVVEVFEGSRSDLPLVVRRAHGFGTITWLGLDLDLPWCAAWPGCDRLLATLLGGRSETDGSLLLAEAGRGRVPDLAGQLRVALDTFATETDRSAGDVPFQSGVPFEIIAGLGVLYALALYPLDWWLVTRSGRPWLSWITLPVFAAGFTAAAWGIGGLWGRDAPPRCHAAEVLDIDGAGGLIRGRSWLAARSPSNARLDLVIAAEPTLDVEAKAAAVSWFADSGGGFGGVDATAAHPSLAADSYRYGNTLAELVGVPIAAASSRLFEAEWTGHLAKLPLTSTLVRDARGLLRGQIMHHLPFQLLECRLLHGGWLYDIGELAPGERYDTEGGRGPRSLAAAVTRRIAVGDRDRAERWDSAGTDVARILEVAGFHEAAGGMAYTSLEPGRLRLDFSPLLSLDRGVLVGVAAAKVRGTAWNVCLHGDAETDPITLLPGAADGGMLVRITIPLPQASDPEDESVEEQP